MYDSRGCRIFKGGGVQLRSTRKKGGAKGEQEAFALHKTALMAASIWC